MDMNRKKQLLEEYKNRKPDMGVISFRCIATGEAFLGISKDTVANLNGIRFRLSANRYPNRRLQDLWNQFGDTGFEVAVLKKLKYEDPEADYTDELEALREQCLEQDKQARRLWR